MTYHKLGCRWGEGQPSFYEMLIKESIVIGQCSDNPLKQPGDIVLIADRKNIVALAEVVGERKLCTAIPELESEFSKYNIAYDNSTYVADAEIWELPEEKRFKYDQPKGRCKIDQEEVIQTASSLMAEFKRSQLEKKCTDLLKSNYNLVLTGAPGTGKTFAAKKVAELMGAVCELVQFHPSYDYTDFVEGLRPVDTGDGIGFERKDGVFKEFCKQALRDVPEKKPYVFIIDEINRGEISKIFGELFYSIDSGYRGEVGRVKTQYQNLVPEDDPFYEGFYVPENVYIIGTMNDIDRSVESIDFAMRRRFAWVEFTAEASRSMLDSDDAWGDAKPQNVGDIKAMMDRLNDCIISDKIGLTRAYQIGAAYFLKYALYNDFNALWNNHLKGVLYEYLRGAYDIDKKIDLLHEAYNN